MSRTISVSEARAGLPRILERVTEGEEVTITRHGKAVAVVVRPDVLRARRAGAALDVVVALRDVIAEAGALEAGAPPVISAARADELALDVRRHRAER
jgi:antitoxin (DNA-binding transcriptional repressor) of toxin-antitoxin stability system